MTATRTQGGKNPRHWTDVLHLGQLVNYELGS